MNEIITKLFDNAKSIYKLYQEIKKNGWTNDYEKLLQYLIDKETKLFHQLDYWDFEALAQKEVFLMDAFGLESLDILDVYPEISPLMLPNLRVLLKLHHLVDLKEPIQNFNSLNLGMFEVFYADENDMILDTIYDSLTLENMVRLMNLAQIAKKENFLFYEEISSQSEQEEYEKMTEEIPKILDALPYDFIYLNETLENLFLGERKIDLPWRLFNTLYAYENKFDSKTLLAAINTYNSDMALGELNKLLMPRKTRTTKAAYIRSLYLNSLLEGLEVDAFHFFMQENADSLLSLLYPFMPIKCLQAVAGKYLDVENDQYLNEEKSVKKTKTKKIKQIAKNPKSEGE